VRREIQPAVVVETPCGAGGCAGMYGVLRLREPLASPVSRFAQDDNLEEGSVQGNVKIRVNVKGNGQECPFHTGVALLR
jgi:hypothetical protein